MDKIELKLEIIRVATGLCCSPVANGTATTSNLDVIKTAERIYAWITSKEKK